MKFIQKLKWNRENSLYSRRGGSLDLQLNGNLEFKDKKLWVRYYDSHSMPKFVTNIDVTNIDVAETEFEAFILIQILFSKTQIIM